MAESAWRWWWWWHHGRGCTTTSEAAARHQTSLAASTPGYTAKMAVQPLPAAARITIRQPLCPPILPHHVTRVAGTRGDTCSQASPCSSWCCAWRPRSRVSWLQSRVDLLTVNRQSCTITEKAPTRAFSWLKVATTAFTFRTLLLNRR